MIKARFFDGETPREHEAEVIRSASYLSVNYLENGFRKEHSFRISDLHPQKDGSEFILTFEGKTIMVPAAFWKEIAPTHSDRWKKLAIPAGLALTVFVSFFLWHDQIVESLASQLPDVIFKSAEEDIRKDMGKKNCLNAEQEKIIESIFMKLGKNRDEFTFFLIPSPEVNAFAMPGKIIVFHDSLLKELTSIEAFTGVLAHEIAHVEKDHIRKQVVKSLFFQYASFAVFGSDGGGMITSLLGGKYNQSEEKEADALAAKDLQHAEINPAGVQAFFAEKGKKEDVFTKYLALSHPDYADRVKTFAPVKKTYPAMSKKDWEILKKGCHSNL
ncbi:MAG: M48 family metallopeptidase [Bdellovibrionota bacterium]